MAHEFIAILVGPLNLRAFADEAAPVPNATRFVAKIKFIEVRQKQTMTMETEVKGTKGTPLKIDLAGQSVGRQLRLEMHDVPDAQPPQYFAQFRLVAVTKERVQKVLAEPALVTVVGRPAKFVSGAEKGDRIEIELTVKEVGTAASAASGEGIATRSGLILGGVTPRIIIEEEEELLETFAP